MASLIRVEGSGLFSWEIFRDAAKGFKSLGFSVYGFGLELVDSRVGSGLTVGLAQGSGFRLLRSS